MAYSEMSVETAQLFLDAFDDDRISTWCNALRAAEEENSLGDHQSPLGAASLRLRQAWWHDGSDEKRKAVHEAAAALRLELEKAEARDAQL